MKDRQRKKFIRNFYLSLTVGEDPIQFDRRIDKMLWVHKHVRTFFRIKPLGTSTPHRRKYR